jgi:hypothetical protein
MSSLPSVGVDVRSTFVVGVLATDSSATSDDMMVPARMYCNFRSLMMQNGSMAIEVCLTSKV